MKNAIILVSGGLDSAVTAHYAKQHLHYDVIKFIFFDYGQRALAEERSCCDALAKNIGAEVTVVDLRWLGSISTAALNNADDAPKTSENDLEDGKNDILLWWVPCRNAIFLMSAIAHAESEFLKHKQRFDILIGLKNEGQVHMKDTTPAFVLKVNELAEEATHHGGYEILAPLIEKDKTEVIALGKSLGVPFQKTYSCYVENGFQNNVPIHCGTCLNCMLRKKGFYWAGVEDPSVYLA